jgi:plasmid stabilization system protein ParE
VARAELAEATSWYADRSLQVANRFVAAIETIFADLEQAAPRFPILFWDVRRISVPGFPYAVYYKLRGTDCLVIAIMHGRRHPRR